MSALLDNVINGNRSDARAQLHKLSKRDACLAVIDLIEDLLDVNGRDTFGGVSDDIADVRRLVEAM